MEQLKSQYPWNTNKAAEVGACKERFRQGETQQEYYGQCVHEQQWWYISSGLIRSTATAAAVMETDQISTRHCRKRRGNIFRENNYINK